MVLSYTKQQAANAFMQFKRIIKEKVLFINLLGKELTQEINGVGSHAPSDGLLC